MTLEVLVAPETLRPGRHGPATGNIWIAFHGHPFPLAGWNDFVVVILEALVSAVHRIVSGASHKEIVHFMEGPYEVHLERNETGALLLSAVERGVGTRLSLSVKEEDLIAALLEPAASIITGCRDKGCSSTEADRLAETLAVLAPAWKNWA